MDKTQQTYAQVIEEYTSANQVTASYVHGLDLISQEQGGERSFYQVDGLGSTRTLTDVSGTVTDRYTYDAYGQLIGQIGDTSNDYLFAGEQFNSELGEYYLRARYYDPSTGRFDSRDPFEGFLIEPVTLQDYIYVGNNPVIYVDPSGHILVEERVNQEVYKGGETIQVIKCLGGSIGTELASQGLYLLLDTLGAGFIPNYVGKAGGGASRNDILGRIISHAKQMVKPFKEVIVVNFPNSLSAREIVVLEEALIDYLRRSVNLLNAPRAAGVSKDILDDARKRIDDVLGKIKRGLC